MANYGLAVSVVIVNKPLLTNVKGKLTFKKCFSIYFSKSDEIRTT
jgi:hypothetical protein